MFVLSKEHILGLYLSSQICLINSPIFLKKLSYRINPCDDYSMAAKIFSQPTGLVSLNVFKFTVPNPVFVFISETSPI